MARQIEETHGIIIHHWSTINLLSVEDQKSNFTVPLMKTWVYMGLWAVNSRNSNASTLSQKYINLPSIGDKKK